MKDLPVNSSQYGTNHRIRAQIKNDFVYVSSSIISFLKVSSFDYILILVIVDFLLIVGLSRTKCGGKSEQLVPKMISNLRTNNINIPHV